jgi:adenylate cyclase
LIIAKPRLRYLTILLLSFSFVAAYLCFLFLPGIFDIWNHRATDQLFVLRSALPRFRPSYNHKVVHVDLTNASIARLDLRYLSRSHYGAVIRNLGKMGVAAQIWDFIFPARMDPADDAAMIDAVRSAGNVYFGLAFDLYRKARLPGEVVTEGPDRDVTRRNRWRLKVEGDDSWLYTGGNPLLTFRELALASRGLGSISIRFDRDGVLRRVPLIVRYGDGYFPTLPFRVVCDTLGVSPDRIVIRPGRDIVLGNAAMPGSDRKTDIHIPIDRQGNILVNTVGPWERMDHYNFADILKASEDRFELEMWAEELRGKIVVVSDVSTGAADLGPIPGDPNYPLSGIHANLIHNILTRSFLKEAAPGQMLLIELAILALLSVMAFRFSSLQLTAGIISLTVIYFGAAVLLFLYAGLLVNLVRPGLMIFFAGVSILVARYVNEEREKQESLRQRDGIRATFGRYLSTEVVEQLLGSPHGLEMTGESREITILVSDLRGFTALTATLPPSTVIDILNRYLERMIEIVALHGGTINELQGDGILAFFGAPLEIGEEADRAVACAIAMQNGLEEINNTQRRLFLPELSIGIGIDTGTVVVGNIGSKRRAKYSAVGTPMNTAFRIESYTTGGQILISPRTMEKAGSRIEYRKTLEVTFKGVAGPVTLYDVIGIDGPYQATLKVSAPDTPTALDTPLPIALFILDGKQVSDVPLAGRIVSLGAVTAEIEMESPPERYDNVKIAPNPEMAGYGSEIYGKVTEITEPTTPETGGRVVVRFTWLPEAAKQRLSEGFEPKETTS